MRLGRCGATIGVNLDPRGDSMSNQPSSLRSLDVELEERAELLSEAARSLPGLPPRQREELRTRVLAFLRGDVAAHLAADERVLYPKIVERLGEPLAVAPLKYDRLAIRWWIDEIACADIDDTDRLQRLLYGVEAVVKLHLSREEDLYVGVDSPAWPAR
jgi:hypothetical protein